MRCQTTLSGPPHRFGLLQRLHALFCPECRHARHADTVIAHGVALLKAEAPPEAGLTATLSAIGCMTQTPQRRQGLPLLRLMRRFPITAAAATFGVCGTAWSAYIDLDPGIHIASHVGVAALPASDGYFDLIRAKEAIPKIDYQHSQNYDNWSKSRVYLALGLRKPVYKAGSAEPTFRATAEREALLAEYRPALTGVRSALKRNFSIPWRISGNGEYEPDGDHLSAARYLALVLQLESETYRDRHQYAASASSALDTIELGAKVSRDTDMIGFMADLDIMQVGIGELWKSIGSLNGEQSRAAAARLDRVAQTHETFVEMLEQERTVALARYRSLFRGNWRLGLLPYMALRNEETTFDQRLSAFIQLSASTKLDLVRDANRQLDWWQAHAGLEHAADLHMKKNALSLYGPPGRDVLTSIVVTSYGLVRFKSLAVHDGQLPLLRAALAVRAYAVERGSAPPDLDAVVRNGYLAAVPVDPFGKGRPIRYRADLCRKYMAAGDARWIHSLYSVGPDGIDNQGDPIGGTGGAILQNRAENPPASSQSHGRGPTLPIHGYGMGRASAPQPGSAPAIRQVTHNIQPDSDGDLVAAVNVHVFGD